VLSNDDAQRAQQRQVHSQLGVPAGGHELVKAVVALAGGEEQGVALLALEDLLDAVADAPVGPVHVTGNDEEHGDRQVVVSDVAHPHAAGHRIQTTFKGEEIAVGRPVTGEEGIDASAETGEQLSQQVLVKELVGQGDVRHGGDGLAIERQGAAGIDGVHQRGGGQRHVDQVTRPGQGTQTKQTGQMVVEHRLNVLEPLELGSCLVVVEDARIEHQTGHHQSTDGQGHELGFSGDAPGPPHVEEA